jgi:hypothetical protein
MDIDETTKVPLFAVFAASLTFVGFVFWLSSIYSSVSLAEKTNAEQDVKIEQTKDLLIDIRERVIRIEEKISHK